MQIKDCGLSSALNELIFYYSAFVFQQLRRLEDIQVHGHSSFVSVLFPTCVYHQRECLGFTWYLLIVVHMLPIPPHGVSKDSRDCCHQRVQGNVHDDG